MTDEEESTTERRVGAGPRGELTLKEAARILGNVHRSRVVYWQKQGWLPIPLTRAAVEAAEQLLQVGQWPPRQKKRKQAAVEPETNTRERMRQEAAALLAGRRAKS